MLGQWLGFGWVGAYLIIVGLVDCRADAPNKSEGECVIEISFLELRFLMFLEPIILADEAFQEIAKRCDQLKIACNDGFLHFPDVVEEEVHFLVEEGVQVRSKIFGKEFLKLEVPHDVNALREFLLDPGDDEWTPSYVLVHEIHHATARDCSWWGDS